MITIQEINEVVNISVGSDEVINLSVTEVVNPVTIQISEFGLQGLKGEKGDTGAGIQGVQGDTGIDGATGLKGDTGSTGATGTQGVQGIKGETGLSGSTQDISGKVDKVTGERLINAYEIVKVSNLSGTNTGDETLTTIQNKLVSTNNLSEGVNNLYFTASRVLASVLTGLSTATATAITAADTILIALGKLQGQINGKQNTISGTADVLPKFGTGGLVGSNITDNGTIVSTSTDLSVNSVRVGRGSGNISTNTVLGVGALNNNSTGSGNFALGESSLFLNQTGFDNIAIGSSAIRNNISGIRNVGIGNGSLLATTGSGNTGIGRNTIASNTTGVNNIAIGNSAGNVIGSGATGATILNSSIFIGNDTRPLFDNQTNQIVIGTSAIGLGSNTTVIGNTSTVFGRFWGRFLTGTSSDDLTNQMQVQGSGKFTSSVQVGNNALAASVLNTGAIRYRSDVNNSYMEISMQTGATLYAWVIIKQNTF
jgi:hypothetical protein